MNQREEVDILFRSHLNTNPNIEISLEPPFWPFGRSLKILSLEIVSPLKNFAPICFTTRINRDLVDQFAINQLDSYLP